MQNSIKEEVDIKKLYGKQATQQTEDFIKSYNIDVNGLSTPKAKSRIDRYGLNEIRQSKPKKWYHYFLSSLFTPFNCILIGIILILYYTDVILSPIPSYANIIVVIVLVLASTLLEFFEEYRSNKAAEKLKEMVATTATVLRDGKKVKLPIKDLTIGDVILLSAGDMIPADLRIIESKDLYVGQSSLTGESDAIKKESNTQLTIDEVESITDLDTICFMGTNVISGSAKGIIIHTADDTYFGKVAKTLVLRETKNCISGRYRKCKQIINKIYAYFNPYCFFNQCYKSWWINSFYICCCSCNWNYSSAFACYIIIRTFKRCCTNV